MWNDPDTVNMYINQSHAHITCGQDLQQTLQKMHEHMCTQSHNITPIMTYRYATIEDLNRGEQVEITYPASCYHQGLYKALLY